MADPSPTRDAMLAFIERIRGVPVLPFDLMNPSESGLAITFLCREIDAVRLENAEVRKEMRLLSGKGAAMGNCKECTGTDPRDEVIRELCAALEYANHDYPLSDEGKALVAKARELVG